MAICITFGTHEFTNQLQGYEGVTAQCHNCGNWSARVITRWPFFEICFVPIIPLSTHKYKEIACPVCNFMQDLSMRPDVQAQGHGGGGGGGGGPQGAMPLQQPPGNQGYGGPMHPSNGGMQYK